MSLSTFAQELPTNGSIETRVGKLTFESGYPSEETVETLYNEMDFQRACQAYLWGIPAVGIAEWRLAHRDIFKAKNGEMLSYLDFAEKLGFWHGGQSCPLGSLEAAARRMVGLPQEARHSSLTTPTPSRQTSRCTRVGQRARC